MEIDVMCFKNHNESNHLTTVFVETFVRLVSKFFPTAESQVRFVSQLHIYDYFCNKKEETIEKDNDADWKVCGNGA